MDDEDIARIKARREELSKELRQANAQVRRVQGQIQALYYECEHPLAYKRSGCATGESYTYCSICGYET